MVELGVAGPNRCSPRILITRLAVMVTTLVLVVLATGSPLTTGRADASASPGRGSVPRSAGLVTKDTVERTPVRPAPRPAAVPQRRTHPAAAPTSATTSTVPPSTPSTAAPPTPTTVTEPVTAPPPAPTTAAVTPAAADVAALVGEVEKAGIEPGPNWSWSMGNPSTACGAIPDPTVATGCTSGAPGAATTVFSGSPTLALVAHELANAETENDAVPSLVTEVSTAEAGTSWSPIDAVASCLVEHFMGFQDNAAGTWQCPADLASTVAADIHGTAAASSPGAAN